MSRAVKESMKLERKLRRALRVSPLLWLLGSGGCAAVLGIEDIHEGPAEGSGGDGASATGGTKPNTGGDKNNGGKSNGGTSPNGGSDSLAGIGNIEGGSGNEAGAGGAPVNTDPTVRGHVIDFWGQDVPNVPIQVGEVLASTDENGEFVFEDVPAEYDVSLAVELDPITSHAWVFQGLTRRDPTLQIYSGSPGRDGNIKVQALDITLGNNQQAKVTIGATGGAEQYTGYQAGLETSFSWRGGPSVQATAHALVWTTNASDLPTSYQGYDSTLIALDEVGTTNISFTLTGTAPESGNLTMTVTPSTSTDRENDVFLRFPSGDRVQLVEDYPDAPNHPSYVVPDATMATVTVSASEGYSSYGAYAVVHKDGLGVGSDVALKIPAPGTLVAPVDGVTGVDLTTKFSYLAGSGSGAMHVVAIHNIYDSCCFDALYIVTDKTQLTIPEVVGANFLKGNEGYYWDVETHGKYQTIDEMTGPSGFLDAYSADEATPQGPNMGDGQYTVTTARGLTPAP